jgi:hypothetical protein
MRRGVFLARHFRGHRGSGELDEKRHILSEGYSRTWPQWTTAWLEIAVYKKVALPAELMCRKYYNHKQLILPLKMANRFIPYVPKPTNARYSSKPLCKNVPKQPSNVDSSRQIERDSVPIRASTVDGDLLMEEVNGDDGIIVRGMLI